MINLPSKLSTELNKIPLEIKKSNCPLARINAKSLEGIQKGIPLFDGEKLITLEDIAFITKNFETLNLFRGCTLGCTHCLKNAKKALENFRTILFEDLERFTEGFKELNERLNFNVFKGSNYINIIDDSNPSDYPIQGLTSKHSTTEAMKLIYDKLHIPTLFVTSGWNKTSHYAQENAEELVKMIKQNPDSVEKVEISINPFLQIMEKSRQELQNGDPDKANLLRNIYTSRMANSLATFIDLFSLNKASIIYRHAGKIEKVGEFETKELYKEIYQKLTKIIGSRIEEFPNLSPEKLTEFDRTHLIEPSGRGRQYFSMEENIKEQSELIEEFIDWQNLTPAEQKKMLFDYSVKCIDINGKVYTTRPALKVSYINTPIELTTPTEIQLNYINKKDTNPIFSEIELN